MTFTPDCLCHNHPELLVAGLQTFGRVLSSCEMKTNLTNWLRLGSAGLLLGVVALLAAGCVVEPYPHPHYAAYYDYDYYPDCDVYFYPGGGIWFWFADGR